MATEPEPDPAYVAWREEVNKILRNLPEEVGLAGQDLDHMPDVVDEYNLFTDGQDPITAVEEIFEVESLDEITWEHVRRIM
jgi:hypothetical protein